MDGEDGPQDVVHPEVRAHINSLVSALGGSSPDDDDGYVLGDDALECLRDMRRWIRFYDEKTNRMDVARCFAESNVVAGDLLPILATWPENAAAGDDRAKARIALACYEVLVLLTWPIERSPDKTTVNHHRHIPVLQLAQLGYKRAILGFDGVPILRFAVRVALPSMAVPLGDRTQRDQGVIKLALFFLRNVAMIAPSPGAKMDDGDELQISRSATIDAFSYQDILLTLLTVSSNMGDDFQTEDVAVMEIIFHLVKRVDLKKLFLDEQGLDKAKAAELTALMDKEAAMLRSHAQRAPKRHNRFGTMVWVDRGGGKMTSLSGQDALTDPATRERKMDSSKAFRPPRRSKKDATEPKDLGPPPSLNHRATQQLRSFAQDFLDSGFNPLFRHVRRSIELESAHVMDYHRGQFFYLVAWFLEAERMRRKSRRSKGAGRPPPPEKDADDNEVGSFNLIAGVLTQEMFIAMNRSLDRSYNDKDWPELCTVMRCFTQVLLTVQEMFESGNEEDEEIAENILNRLFYEEATHDAIANIVRTYKDQGFEYLDACTDLTHTFLRILEAYSKQNVDLQVRSRKRTRRRKKKKKAAEEASAAADRADGETAGRREDPGGDGGDSSADDRAGAERTSKERKFDFGRFALRFIPQGAVDTFVKLAGHYRDLDDAQLKRAHRYLYRVAFKLHMSVMLFRVDIIHLLHNMIKGPEPLDRNSTAFREWEELSRQVIRKCVRKLEERPALVTELLFSKINSTAHYLEYGYEKQTLSAAANPRPAAELEFRHAVDPPRQVAIAVGALLDKSQADHIAWVKSQLAAAESERRAWEAAEKAMPSIEGLEGEAAGVPSEATAARAAPFVSIRADSENRRTAMLKNPHLRLLMKLVGMERLAPTLDETLDSVWIFPAGVTADALAASLDHIAKAEFSPPTFDQDASAADQLRRKTAPRRRARPGDDGDDDDDVNDIINDDEDDEDGILFPMGGPTTRKPIDGDERKKASQRRRRKRAGTDDEDDEDEGPTREELSERARKRRARELEKARRIKSELYVHPSDDETDEERDREFFSREDERHRRLQRDMSNRLKALLADDSDDEAAEAAPLPSTTAAAADSRVGSPSPSRSPSLSSSPPSGGRRKRKSDALVDGPEDKGVGSGGEAEAATGQRKNRRKSGPGRRRAPAQKPRVGDDDAMDLDSTTTSASEDGEEALEASSPGPSRTIARAAGDDNSRRRGGGGDGDDDDDDGPLVARKARPQGRARGGFVVDSSDEE